ncbi:MAG: SprT-like domain-containing protein [Propionibacteriaceae bacterium]|jgi:predicted SprT family Zn-dependent metalloprotease|nr:SprT-like domain-containing protein [Propionibacteriaceae bacterium]
MRTVAQLDSMLADAIEIVFAVCGPHHNRISPEVKIRKYKTAYGKCVKRYNGGVVTCQISLADNFVQDGTDEQLMDVLLHEVLHTYPGESTGHNEAFLQRANQLNALGYSIKVRQRFPEVRSAPPNWWIVCHNCGARLPRYRKPTIDLRFYRCGKCQRSALAVEPAKPRTLK